MEAAIKPPAKKRVYFPGLNAIRFWAAFAVIIHHVEQNKYWLGIDNLWGHPIIDGLGHKGVSLFFVLSGFLITYLLLAEIAKAGKVNLKKFYIRRTLRIWPLYFLIVVLAFFILPALINPAFFGEQFDQAFSWKTFLLYLFILPNVARLGSTPMIGANQTWSVGIEEQFYILWPILIGLFHRALLPFLLIFIGVKMLLGIGLVAAIPFVEGTSYSFLVQFAERFWTLFQIEQMAIGAIGAWALYHQKQRILDFIYNKWVQAAAYLSFIPLMVFHVDFIGVTLFEAVIFCIFIMNVSTNSKFKWKMEHPRYTFLGNISYGIYMFHTSCIAIIIWGMTQLGFTGENGIVFNLLLYGLSIAATIAVSALSYNYFEKWFLKWKDGFAVVKSGNHKPESDKTAMRHSVQEEESTVKRAA